METTGLIDILSRGEDSHHQFKESLSSPLNSDLSGYDWHLGGN